MDTVAEMYAAVFWPNVEQRKKYIVVLWWWCTVQVSKEYIGIYNEGAVRTLACFCTGHCLGTLDTVA